jgi:hypothetical protein
MMLSMHAILRDRFSRLSSGFDVALVSAGTVLCATTFLDPAVLDAVGVPSQAARLALGTASVAVFLLSLISLRVDWKERSARHQHACKSLSDLKLKCRELRAASAERRAAEGPEFIRAAAFVASELPPIPDAQFARLKSKHKVKVEVSRLLDRYPGLPPWILRWSLRWRDLRAFAHGEKQVSSTDPTG